MSTYFGSRCRFWSYYLQDMNLVLSRLSYTTFVLVQPTRLELTFPRLKVGVPIPFRRRLHYFGETPRDWTETLCSSNRCAHQLHQSSFIMVARGWIWTSVLTVTGPDLQSGCFDRLHTAPYFWCNRKVTILLPHSYQLWPSPFGLCCNINY